jgi:hypothetical protein
MKRKVSLQGNFEVDERNCRDREREREEEEEEGKRRRNICMSPISTTGRSLFLNHAPCASPVVKLT